MNVTGCPEAGNPFLMESTGYAVNMDRTSRRTSMRFTAQQTGTVQSVRFYFHDIEDDPEYTFGIQGDDSVEPTGGDPDGTWIGWGVEDDFEDPGWQVGNLNQQTANLVAGQVYHLVGYCSADCDDLSVRLTSPNNQNIPFLNVFDDAAQVLKKSGSWSSKNAQPVYILEYLDGYLEGNPYHDSQHVYIYGNNYVGQKFFVEAPGGSIDEVGFFVAKEGGTPADDLYIQLDNLTDGVTVFQDMLVFKTGVSNDYKWENYIFSGSLAGDKYYRLFLYSPGSSSSKRYRVYRLVTHSEQVYADLTYGGDEEFYTHSTDGGSYWQDDVYSDIGGFRIISPGGTGYYTAGTYVSDVLDTGSETTGYQFIEWDETLAPASDIRFQVQTASTLGGLSTATLVGSDGTNGTYYETSRALIVVDPGASGTQFVRFTGYLTGDSASTPVLESVKIYYVP